jgi:saccharopine dehydrogenase (NAD+, L-lysine-forming)
MPRLGSSHAHPSCRCGRGRLGPGPALARIAARRPFAELVIADYDLARAQRAAAARDGYEAVQLDARDERAVAELLTQRHCDVLMNATDPRFVMPLFRAALQAGKLALAGMGAEPGR